MLGSEAAISLFTFNSKLCQLEGNRYFHARKIFQKELPPSSFCSWIHNLGIFQVFYLLWSEGEKWKVIRTPPKNLKIDFYWVDLKWRTSAMVSKQVKSRLGSVLSIIVRCALLQSFHISKNRSSSQYYSSTRSKRSFNRDKVSVEVLESWPGL